MGHMFEEGRQDYKAISVLLFRGAKSLMKTRRQIKQDIGGLDDHERRDIREEAAYILERSVDLAERVGAE